MTAATACRTCGTEAREGARFCDGCGAPITERDAHAEYKQVTVLFADVVHSMDIAATVGAERLPFWGPARIGSLFGLHPSTVHGVLARYRWPGSLARPCDWPGRAPR